MKKVFILLFAMLIPLFAFAINSDELDFGKLTKDQQIALLQQANEMKKANQESPISHASTKDAVREWASIGAEFGHGLAATAHELGVEVNAFMNTPVGTVTAAIIVWKLMGGALVHIVGGVVFGTVLLSVWLYLYRRQCLIESVEYTGLKWFGLFGKKNITYRTKASGGGDSLKQVFTWILIVGVMVTLAIIFSY